MTHGPLWMPLLPTERLEIREFTLDDLNAVASLLDGPSNSRAAWLAWTVSSYAQLDAPNQPP